MNKKQCEHKLRNASCMLFSENNRDNQVLNEYYFRFSSIYFVFFEIISRIIGNFIVAVRKWCTLLHFINNRKNLVSFFFLVEFRARFILPNHQSDMPDILPCYLWLIAPFYAFLEISVDLFYVLFCRLRNASCSYFITTMLRWRLSKISAFSSKISCFFR